MYFGRCRKDEYRYAVGMKIGNSDSVIELGLIRMTLPDKPNSKNQRYIKE